MNNFKKLRVVMLCLLPTGSQIHSMGREEVQYKPTERAESKNFFDRAKERLVEIKKSDAAKIDEEIKADRKAKDEAFRIAQEKADNKAKAKATKQKAERIELFKSLLLKNDTNEAIKLLEKHKSLSNTIIFDNSGTTALHYAIMTDNHLLIKALLSNDADINATLTNEDDEPMGVRDLAKYSSNETMAALIKNTPKGKVRNQLIYDHENSFFNSFEPLKEEIEKYSQDKQFNQRPKNSEYIKETINQLLKTYKIHSYSSSEFKEIYQYLENFKSYIEDPAHNAVEADDDYTKAYKTLGLEAGATTDDVKRAYKKLALKYHPDKNPGNDTTEMFQKISDAHDRLNQ